MITKAKDDILYTQLINIIKDKNKLPQDLLEYKHIITELEVRSYTEEELIIYQGAIIVIPKRSRKRISEVLHDGRLGLQCLINQCKNSIY